MATKENVDLRSIQDRIQKAGLTMDELKEAVAGTDRTVLYQRIRAAGLSLDDVRLICCKDSDIALHLSKTNADIQP
jgi:hypothetical protein